MFGFWGEKSKPPERAATVSRPVKKGVPQNRGAGTATVAAAPAPTPLRQQIQTLEELQSKLPELGDVISHGETVKIGLAEEIKSKLLVTGHGKRATIVISPEMTDPRMVAGITDRLKQQGFAQVRSAYVTSTLFKTIIERKVVSVDSTKTDSEAWRLFTQQVEVGAQVDASDVHICVREQQGVVLYRVDGDIEKLGEPLPAESLSEMVRAAFNSQSEKGANQGSSLKFTENQRTAIPIDLVVDGRVERAQLRFQFLKARGGWDVVMRIMWMESSKKKQKAPTLREELLRLGYSKDQAKLIELAVRKANGSVLIAGQTGSGKTTTLYAILSHIAIASKKTYSIEDPVEGQLFNVTQLPVQTVDGQEVDEAYADIIKAILRGDPDTVMVSEMRGRETGSAFKQCTQSGHLTLSTVHVGSSLGIVDRVSSDEIGVPRDVLCSPDFLNILIYQKLAQRLCDHCKIPVSVLKVSNPTEVQKKQIEYLRKAGVTDKLLGEIDRLVNVDGVYVRHNDRIADANGVYSAKNGTYGFPNNCPHCRGRGINGRTVCAEVNSPTDDLLELLREGRMVEARKMVRENVAPLDVDNFEGKTAIEHAFWKMGQGQIDPREIESNFEPLEGYLRRSKYNRHEMEKGLREAISNTQQTAGIQQNNVVEG